MNKKAQGLPVTTIVVIILVLMVLAAVALVFVYGFVRSGGGLTTAATPTKCKAMCSTLQAQIAGHTLDITAANADCSGGWTAVKNSKYCDTGCASPSADYFTHCEVVTATGSSATIVP